VIALAGQLAPREELRQLLVIGEGEAVDARHHRVFFAAAPIGAGDAVELERVRRNLAGRLDVRSLAHVDEGAAAIETQALDALDGVQIVSVFDLERLLQFLEQAHAGGEVMLLALEAQPACQDLAHALFDLA